MHAKLFKMMRPATSRLIFPSKFHLLRAKRNIDPQCIKYPLIHEGDCVFKNRKIPIFNANIGNDRPHILSRIENRSMQTVHNSIEESHESHESHDSHESHESMDAVVANASAGLNVAKALPLGQTLLILTGWRGVGMALGIKTERPAQYIMLGTQREIEFVRHKHTHIHAACVAHYISDYLAYENFSYKSIDCKYLKNISSIVIDQSL